MAGPRSVASIGNDEALRQGGFGSRAVTPSCPGGAAIQAAHPGQGQTATSAVRSASMMAEVTCSVSAVPPTSRVR